MYLRSPFSSLSGSQSYTRSVKFSNGATVPVEVMDTPELRATGMQFRTSMDRPMLFVFPDEAKRSYHMRNVRMPLDLILMNSGGRVLSMHSMMPSQIQTGGSLLHSQAIEAPAGWAQANNLKIGDVIRWG
jgi:uncharacterized membrane protein (UPF0127 family)